MNQIDLSIWGIRDGFEKDGIFHTHNLQAVKAKHNDRLRTLSNNLGSKGFFTIQHVENKVIISHIDTDINEYTPNGSGRPGYVVFSLIIDNDKQFNKSPRDFLISLSKFYKSRVKEGNQNNFTEEEIRTALASLSLIPSDRKNIQEQISGFSYYTDSSSIDSYLTGNIPFAAFGELTLIPTQLDSSGNYKEVLSIEDVTKSKLQYINIFEAERLFRKKQEDDREREILAQQELKRKQAITELFSRDISELIKLDNTEELLQKYNSFEYKQLLDPQLIRLIQEQKEKYDKRAQNKLESQREQELIQQLYAAHRNKDLARAIIIFDQIKNKTVISSSIINELAEFEKKNAETTRELHVLEVQKRETKKSNKKRLENIAFVTTLLIILAALASYHFQTPAYFYSSVESPNPSDTIKSEDRETTPIKDDTTIRDNGGVQIDDESNDTLKSNFLNHKNISSMHIEGFKKPFGIVYIQYSEKGDYRKAATEPELKNPESIIRDIKLIELLNNRFGLNVTVPRVKNPKPEPKPETEPKPKPESKPEGPKGGQKVLIDFPSDKLTTAKTYKKNLLSPEMDKNLKKNWAIEIKAIKKLYDEGKEIKYKANKLTERILEQCEAEANKHIQ